MMVSRFGLVIHESPPGPAIRMWRADGDGKPMIPHGDPEPLPLRPLWGNVSVNPSKANQEKEVMRAGECLEK